MRPRQIPGLPLCQAVFLTLVGFFAWAGTIFVPADFPTIQEAIDAAVDGDVIQVDPGTYVENIDFLGKAITLQSTVGPDVTIIDGSACTTGVDFCSVVTFAADEGPDSVLAGFTVTGGSGSTGGGICCDTASPTIINCTISGNGANSGGGLYCRMASPAIFNCAISGNGASGGGGMKNVEASAPTLTGCTIRENWAAAGGGVYNSDSSPTLNSCKISENYSMTTGGGIANHYSSSLTLMNCTISGNTTGLWLSSASGGGISNYSSSLMLTNCRITGNLVRAGCNWYTGCGEGRGGGIATGQSSSLTATNCTISDNRAIAGAWNGEPDGDGGGVWSAGDSVTVTNSILWENSPNEIESGSASGVVVTFSDIQGGYAGIGNIDMDPFFVDPAEDDYHLAPCSPAIDTGDNAAPYLPPTDFEGDPRIENGIVDMGMDEVLGGPGPCPPGFLFVRGDCNDDGAIDISDPVFLLSELFAGGDPAPCDDACDLNDDGFKDIGDVVYGLNALFAGGPAPAPPHPSCGSDPTTDGLGCASYTGCP